MSTAWNSILSQLPNPHILQTNEWGNLKTRMGWKPIHFLYPSGSETPTALTLLLKRQLNFGKLSTRYCILYAPKGPITDWDSPYLRIQVINQLEKLAKTERAIFVKIDPDIIIGYGQPGTESEKPVPTGVTIINELKNRNWVPSEEQIQFRNTIYIDLAPDYETILAKMKQKTRYNIRLSERKGIRVRFGNLNDLGLLFQYYAETSVRDGFVIRDREYYLQMWNTFLQANMADILIAEYEGEFVAGLILYRFGTKAWYMYGMSRTLHRDKMPTYLLQWKAIQHAKLHGCTIYDLWGAPDKFDELDPMWGVYRFKEGFGGTLVRTIGAWDYPVNSFLYSFYSKVMPLILGAMRSRGKNQTKNQLLS